ncbi:MAG: hypothetical protein KDE27_07770 [Planctomycetes bacterium]|nr:hypothetical protein [Planctomycetota bacterium]
MKRTTPTGVACAAVLHLASCSGNSPTPLPDKPTNDFLVLRHTPQNNGSAYLNDVVVVDFSLPVDLDTVNFDAIAFQAFDALGNGSSEPVSGTFRLETAAQDQQTGRRLIFEPSLPTTDDFADGGFKPGRSYLVQLVGGDRHNGTAVRSVSGRPLATLTSFRFDVVEGSSPAQLFRNPLAGGPRRTPVDGLTISGVADDRDVALNLFGAPPVEIRLRFDQALNPHRVNLPVRFDTDPAVRKQSERGRIYLEYDDPEHGVVWIPADVSLERNDSRGATVLLRPVGVLPNNAEIRVIVESEVEDISGESNVGVAAYDRVFGRFHTASAYGQQWNGIVERFLDRAAIDFDAVFEEPLAEVGPGWIRAGFDFEGSDTTRNFHPTTNDVVLNTSFTQITPENGLPFNVSGGLFKFHDVTIPQGAIVRGQGPNPMVWLCTGKFQVDGTLSVRGGDGARVDTLNSANFAKGGGVGSCGGGSGGDGSPNQNGRSLRGGTGRGPGQVPGGGGSGGLLSCLANCMQGNGGGSAGGGGSLATQGDPWYLAPALPGSAFRQREGDGGDGCSGTAGNRTVPLEGGRAGPTVFVDDRADNDFFGVAIDRNRGIRIRGELEVPIGGGGGGGGGDHSDGLLCSGDQNFVADESGGGGGAGGGVLIVKALGEIVVGPTGHITADGGHGGGGAWAGSCGRGGGGGGGAGGMVILMSSQRIVLHAHGSATRWNYSQLDYDFCVSADGGVCPTGQYATYANGTPIYGKYRDNGQAPFPGTTYDQNPLGGFGGMGIVQFHAPVGTDNADDTNTRLDDHIDVYRGGQLQTGAAKQAILAWRGHPDDQGVYRDDFGDPVTIGNDEGDIRPAPKLMPVTFGRLSRLRSKWIDTGASGRRPLAAADGAARGLVLDEGNMVGPFYEFAGVEGDRQHPRAGFANYEDAGGDARIVYPVVVDSVAIAAAHADREYQGRPAYEIELARAALGDVADRYRQYQAELLNGTNGVVGSFRIVGHDGRTVWLDAGTEVLAAGAVSLRVIAKFFRVDTNNSEGLGRFANGTGQSLANVRIGFAFHQDPGTPGALRFPMADSEFVYSMSDPDLIDWIAQNGEPRYVQWDVTFDIAHATGRSASPTSPRPTLSWLRIPFRF